MTEGQNDIISMSISSAPALSAAAGPSPQQSVGPLLFLNIPWLPPVAITTALAGKYLMLPVVSSTQIQPFTTPFSDTISVNTVSST